jgi:uncharacterized protein DUF2637
VSAGADRWIRWTTIGCVALLALITGTVSYLHMHMLVAQHGQPGWVAALTPLSVDGMIVAASTTFACGLAVWPQGRGTPVGAAGRGQRREPRCQRGRGRADPDRPGDRGVAIVRAHSFLRAADPSGPPQFGRRGFPGRAAAKSAPAAELRLVRPPELGTGNRIAAGVDLQRRAWQWALAHRASDGSLPSGSAIGAAHGRHERWGRLVKNAGQAGTFGHPGRSQTGLPHADPGQAAAAGSEGGQ